MNNTKFKPGDKVRCINNNYDLSKAPVSNLLIELGEGFIPKLNIPYIIGSIDEDCILLKNNRLRFAMETFELIDGNNGGQPLDTNDIPSYSHGTQSIPTYQPHMI